MAKHKLPAMVGPPETYQPGSPAWVESMSVRLHNAMQQLTDVSCDWARKHVIELLEAKPEPWKVYPEGKPFGSPDAYCKAVTGMTWDQVVSAIATLTPDERESKRLTRIAKVALGRGQAETRPQGKHFDAAHHTDGMKMPMKQGGNPDYLLRRLARDRPDILDRYEAGEFKSARAAAIEAGIINQPDPVQVAKKAFEKIPRQFRPEFIQWLRDNGYV